MCEATGRWCASPLIPDRCDKCFDPATSQHYPAEGYREEKAPDGEMWRYGTCHRCVDKTATYDQMRDQALADLAKDVVGLVLDAKVNLEAAVKEKIENFRPPMTWASWTLSAEDIDMVYEERLKGPELTEENYEAIARYFTSCAEHDLGEMWQEYLEDGIMEHVEGVEDKEDDGS